MCYKKYDHDVYTSPLWEGEKVYNETLMFVGESEAPLLYYPEEIVSVMSCDLKTEYVKGKDYILKDGKIVLLEGTSIPVTPIEEYYPENPEDGKYFNSTVEGHKYIMFGEKDFMFKRQIHVSYTHKDKWDGFIPEKSKKLQRFYNKAMNGEEVTVLFFGDSITTGANSSGAINVEPFADDWCTMVIKSMKKHFNNENIKYVNTAVGGMNTQWGFDTVKENAIDYNPDLMILAFGMNDPGKQPEEFAEITKTTLDKYLAACPNSDVAVIATMIPHFRLKGFWGNQEKFESALYKLTEAYEHVETVPVTSVHKAVLEKKRYYDMSGNNVNHPNDFMARLYAQTVNRVILG